MPSATFSCKGLAGRSLATSVALAVILASRWGPVLQAHDLFFRAPRYVLAPQSETIVDVLNGTFSKSENGITRDRLADVSLVTPDGRVALEPERWTEPDPKSTVRLTMGAAGTYLLGAAIRPRMLALSGADFNAYLKEEGITEMLARRTTTKRLDEPSRERYSKYVKALLQVGDSRTDAYATVLGYAAEIVPEQNPYSLKAGGRLVVRCVVDGHPWAGKVIFAGGRRGSSDVRLAPQRLVTDEKGRATVRLSDAGVWYVKFVAMTEIAGADANYESKWSTLSFAVE